jgi:choline dehydrogenase-like flavoprotein
MSQPAPTREFRGETGLTHWVIVGAGSAGCVLAHRLSENPADQVTLCEAGPATFATAESDSFYDLLSQPERSFSDLKAVRVTGTMPARYRVGRGLGGSSAINAMVATPGGPYLTDHLIPMEYATTGERGAVDRALLAAAPDAEPVRLTRWAGMRVDAATAYLKPVLTRPNLTIRGFSEVEQLLMIGGRCVGVRLSNAEEISADQVVISAGALHSPVVLLRSGITTGGIGEGLKDHVSAPITLALHPDARSDPSALALTTLLQRGQGHILPMNHLGREATSLGLLMGALMVVHSHGNVRLDPNSLRPVAQFEMLSDPRDLSGLAEVMQSVIAILNTDPFRDIISEAYIDEFGTSVTELDSYDKIAAWLVDHVGEYAHAACSNQMGVVVDEMCRVFGYQGVRVCDASVFRDLPPVNTHIPTVMLAEHMAEQWKMELADA